MQAVFVLMGGDAIWAVFGSEDRAKAVKEENERFYASEKRYDLAGNLIPPPSFHIEEWQVM